MVANCSYARSVWQQVELWSGEQQLKQNLPISNLSDWWTKLNPGGRRGAALKICEQQSSCTLHGTYGRKDVEGCLTTLHKMSKTSVIKADVRAHQQAWGELEEQ